MVAVSRDKAHAGVNIQSLRAFWKRESRQLFLDASKPGVVLPHGTEGRQTTNDGHARAKHDQSKHHLQQCRWRSLRSSVNRHEIGMLACGPGFSCMVRGALLVPQRAPSPLHLHAHRHPAALRHDGGWQQPGAPARVPHDGLHRGSQEVRRAHADHHGDDDQIVPIDASALSSIRRLLRVARTRLE